MGDPARQDLHPGTQAIPRMTTRILDGAAGRGPNVMRAGYGAVRGPNNPVERALRLALGVRRGA
jgi:hypothetical protein